MAAIPDEDVDEFLDSMLDEFDDEQEQARVEAETHAAIVQTRSTNSRSSSHPPLAPDPSNSAAPSEEELMQFMQQFVESDFAKSLQNEIENDPEATNALAGNTDIGKLFQDLMKSLPDGDRGEENVETKFETPSTVQESLDTAIKMVSAGAKDVLPSSQPSSGMSPDDALLQQMLGEFKEMDIGDNANMDQIVEQMMGQVLSKQVLLPPLQQIIAKYPEWLRDNEASLTSEQSATYVCQLKIFERMSTVLEADDSDSGDHSKGEVLQLMNEMQKYGQPPQELVSLLAPGLSFDADGQPVLPDPDNGGDGCVLM